MEFRSPFGVGVGFGLSARFWFLIFLQDCRVRRLGNGRLYWLTKFLLRILPPDFSRSSDKALFGRCPKAVYHSSQVSFFYWTGRFSRLPGTSGESNVLCKYITRVMPFSQQIGLSRKIVYLIYLVHAWVCNEEGGKVSLLSHIKTTVFYSSQ